MSADNYYVITKEHGKYVGRMLFVSDWETSGPSIDDVIAHQKDFECDTLNAALVRSQDTYTEYGVEYWGDVADNYVI